MPTRHARLLLPIVAVPLVVLACGGGAAAVTTIWPAYHLTPGRSGADSGEPSFRNLHTAWTSSTLDGAVYAEPLIAGDNVIAVTENDSVYAFNVATGAPAWSQNPVGVGTARTGGFPCGDIMPLGITGTPVIDAGALYVLAETEQPTGTYRFHLIKMDPATGSITWNHDVTPAGMLSPSDITSYQQERSALAVSNGNIVIVWGGLDGDCGPYHGFVETVSEATGAAVHEWSDTTRSGDREGGLWATSGAAVDSAGNIFVSTGNGQVSDITQYAGDYGDSVLKFAPSLGNPSAFFAPGPPQSWATNNANDTDLGSVGPALLPNGLVFSIGKGGRGYLLNQASLPNNSNPGGGENASTQVCNGGAFGGTAATGGVVYVPCSDGIAAVSIDGTHAMHRTWYSHDGGAPPIVAGGLVWTTGMFGGSTLFGLNTSDGSTAVSLPLPATTQHFATPASADNHLFMGAGNRLIAFVPPTPMAAPIGGGYQLDGWGGVHQYGGAAQVSFSGYAPGHDIARGIVMRPDRASGFVLDGYGDVSPFGLALPPAGGPSWPHWDIARAIALNPCDGSGDSGYVLDGWGGVHPFGGAPPLIFGAYWPGFDIARALAMNACAGGVVTGYVLDGWGGVHACWQVGTPHVANPAGGPYWRGWDIARGIVVTGPGAGEVLDGWGNVHPFGGAAPATVTASFTGRDVVRSVTYAPSLHGGYTMDAFGGLHAWWLAGSPGFGTPSSAHWSYPIARALAQ